MSDVLLLKKKNWGPGRGEGCEEFTTEKLEREAKLAAEKKANERRLAIEEKRLAAEKLDRVVRLAAGADERRIAAEREERQGSQTLGTTDPREFPAQRTGIASYAG